MGHLTSVEIAFASFYPQIINLAEDKTLQTVIIMIRMTCFSGANANGYMVEILWHRRETRRQTEKTNINLYIGRNRSTQLNVILDNGKIHSWYNS